MYVYILGAGASKADGAPVTSEIFGAAFRNVNVERVDGSRRFVSTVSPFEGNPISEFLPVFELFDKWERTRLAPKWSGLPKEIYTPLPHQVAVDTRRFGHFYSKLYRINRGLEPCDLTPEVMKDIWRKATWLFYHTIGSAGWHRECKYYQAFVERTLARPGVHCVISFNVDTLLDNCLYRLCCSFVPGTGVWERKKELEWTYGVEFGVRDGMREYEFRHDAKILYYKPHGSLHWGLSRETGQVSLHHPAESSNYEKLFLRQDSNEDALVILPIEEKELPLPLQGVWNGALDAMSRAEELFVIGYSAPDTDNREAAQLFGKASASLKRVVIANPCESNRQRIRDLLVNFGTGQVIEYHDFEECLKREFEETCAAKEA